MWVFIILYYTEQQSDETGGYPVSAADEEEVQEYQGDEQLDVQQGGGDTGPEPNDSSSLADEFEFQKYDYSSEDNKPHGKIRSLFI